MSLVRLAVSILALVASGGLATACGTNNSAVGETDGSAAGAARAAGATGPVTRARAIAYAHAINLKAGDVPGMTVAEPEREAPTLTRSAAEFTRCDGGVSHARTVAKINSPEFSAGRGRNSELVQSRVEVWPTPGLVAQNTAAFFGPRGRACFLGLLEASNARLDKQRGRRQHGVPTLATVPNPLPGVEQSFLYTIKQPLLLKGHLFLYIYHDVFSFVSGAAEVELEATGFSRPVPPATEERLVRLLLGRAKASKL
jgi:hypothetical protein